MTSKWPTSYNHVIFALNYCTFQRLLRANHVPVHESVNLASFKVFHSQIVPTRDGVLTDRTWYEFWDFGDPF